MPGRAWQVRTIARERQACAYQLKEQADTELHHTGEVHLRRDASKAAASQRCIGRCEHGRVEGIKRFSPELPFEFLDDREAFKDRDVPVSLPGATHFQRTGEVAERSASGRGECRRVDVAAQPLLQAAARYW